MKAYGLMLLAWAMGLAVPVRAAPSNPVFVGVHILNPPDPITDLTASPVGIQTGQAQLVWTAPRNSNEVAINRYLIRSATFSAISVGDPNAWWSLTSASEQIITPAHAPGVIEFTTLSNLTVGVTNYFAIESIDADGMTSPIDIRAGTPNQAACLPVGSPAPPPTPTAFAGVALSTDALSWSWNASTSALSYTLYAVPSGLPVVTTTNTAAIESGFGPNTAVTRMLRAFNNSGPSSATPQVTVYTLAMIPSQFTVATVGLTSVQLTWNANGNPANTFYRIERSLDATNFTPVALITTLTYTDTGLTGGTTYYYRARAVNGDGIATAPTPAVSAIPAVQGDTQAPMAPMGLKGALDPTGRAFTLIWEDVTRNVDKTPISDLAGYNIYRGTTLTGPRFKITPSPISFSAFADVVNGQTFYYTVRAVDRTGNESGDSLIADSSPLDNIIFLAGDGLSSVRMPDSVSGLLRSANNKYGVPLFITMDEKPIPDPAYIVRYIRLNLVRSDTLQPVTDIAFALPQAVVSVGYGFVNGEVGIGAPQSENAPAAPVKASNLSPDRLSLYWNNGITWVKAGGTLDQSSQVLRVKSSYLGDYQLRSVASATSLSLSQGNVFPRLFTPNGDGLNDRVYFVLENPNNSGVVGHIYDTEGRLVATLPPPAMGGIGTTLIWDGKDSSGQVVPAGIYLYKIEGEGQTFTGSVGVAR